MAKKESLTKFQFSFSYLYKYFILHKNIPFIIIHFPYTNYYNTPANIKPVLTDSCSYYIINNYQSALFYHFFETPNILNKHNIELEKRLHTEHMHEKKNIF